MPANEILPRSASAPRASVYDTARFGLQAMLPTLATGVIRRRPTMMALAERLQTDRSLIRLLHRFRGRYAPGPLRFVLPGRELAVVLRSEDARRVLAESPDPFAPANVEKQFALNQFQPHGVLVSQGAQREERRAANEKMLQPQQSLHQLAAGFQDVVRAEASELLAGAERRGTLSWSDFGASWWRIVRRVVLGDGARDDTVLIDQLNRLRGAGNWAFLLPRRSALRNRFLGRLTAHVRRAEPGSLAWLTREVSVADSIDLPGQFPHWLFAFDAAGMVTYRALALLACHREQLAAAKKEIAAAQLDRPQQLPYLRSCVLESVRLWPTTPVILRDAGTDTAWQGGTVPSGTALLVLAPYFHRDTSIFAEGDSFVPEIWLDGRAQQHPALVPFSGGPAQCPGQNLVLFVTSILLAELLRQHEFWLGSSILDTNKPLPATLNHFGLKFSVARKSRDDRET